MKKTLLLLAVLFNTPTYAAADDAVIAFAFKNERLELRDGDIVDAAPIFDQANYPAVSFRMSKDITKKFGELTSRHVGEAMDLIICGELINSPMLNEPILGGSGMISGHFTVEETVKLATKLKEGSCAAPLTN